MNWHLLVVDDETLNLEIICELLDAPEYRLTLAENGEQAWSALQAAQPPVDMVILDRMMPVLDGMSLLRRIKADSRYKDLPVIMQTAASAPEEVREGMDAGAYYYLTKPYQPEALLVIVRAALSHLVDRRDLQEAKAKHENVLSLVTQAVFEFSSLDEAQVLGGSLALLCPDPGAVALGLTELLVNAIEHGNLGISYAEKKQLRQSETWEQEVARRLALPENAGRKAKVRVERSGGGLVFTVEDQGPGFDWWRYLDFDPERAFDPNGRGIAMARQISFSQLDYLGRGNVVVATIGAEPVGMESA